MTPAAIRGWGVCLPSTRVTNADLEGLLDTTDAWIVERTGISERRVATPEETTATLAVGAGAAAIKHAGLIPSDVDLLVLSTSTPEQPLPETSAMVADGLGLNCGAFDVGAACAGFPYALVVGASLLDSGPVDTVLVIGSDTLTRLVNPGDRATAVLFGDGAGAVVLRPTTTAGHGLLAWDMGCDPSGAALLEVRAGGSRMPTTTDTLAAGQQWLRMEGREVFRRAVRAVVDSVLAAVGRAGVGVDDIAMFIPHQANARMIDAIAARLGIPAERTAMNVDRYGNTSAASIPIALAEVADAGRLADGDLVVLSGFGAGMTWASVVLRWGGA